MLIFICGFMGSGKTFLLRKIKNNQKSGLEQFIDLDDEIYERFSDFKQESSLGELIDNRGWDFFRSKERELIHEYCTNKTCLESIRTVITLGGGALILENLQAIKNCADACLVWLDTPFEECFERIKNSCEARPLVKKGKEFLYDLFEERQENYSQAHLRLSTEDQKRIKNLDDLLACRKTGLSLVNKAKYE